MFGLRNIRGSCWINACLQSLFRIPDVQKRYDSDTFDAQNPVDSSLHKIWKTKGEDGLEEFYSSVRSKDMPAGLGIGDTHELIQCISDKIPFFDELFRFKMATRIKCDNCDYTELKEDSVNELTIATSEKNVPLSKCVADSMAVVSVTDWKCEKCGNKGCKSQQLIGTFPKAFVFHMIPLDGALEYSSLLSINKREYALSAVACYNGSHWWAYGRDMPPGSSWYTLDDTRVQQHGPKQFPLSSRMRLLIYYRLEN